ncbi:MULTISPECIES: glycine zipper domain-containing protein [unclassified Pseudomonas]|uniref:glycine zipper domain-containing protein n=1 Tax=unclassified Pseudomonas TaxID=196821 RepID=UPI001CC1BCA5|nr:MULTISPECIES: glycine zipper domain-containing protein [unclassified Pseudomonas]
MADSQYSLASVTANSVGSLTVGAGVATLGLAGLMAPLAQLNQALNTVSLDIRLLTAGQNKLGEVLMSLTALLSSTRSVLKWGAEEPVADSEAQSSLPGIAANDVTHHLGTVSLNVSAADFRGIVPGSGEAGGAAGTTPKQIATASPRDNSAADQLKSDNAPVATSNLEGNVAKAQSAQDTGTPSKTGSDALSASFSRLGRAVTPDISGPLTSLSVQVDKLGTFAENNSTLATVLAGVAVALGSIASVVGAAVATEALTNVAKKIIKRGAPKIPFGLGKLISEDNRDVDQAKKDPPPEKQTKDSLGYTGDQARKQSRDAKRGKAGGRSSAKDQSPIEVTVQSRTVRPVIAEAQSLVSFSGSGQASPLLGKVAKVGTLLPKKAPRRNVLGAGVDLAQGVANGDTKAIASSAGMMAGSYVGAALGTLILPGVGTAIGGFLGGITGSWLGEKLATPSDQLGAPDQVSKELTSAPTQNQQINYSPSIQVTCTGGESSEHIRTIVAQQLQTQFHGEFVPLMSTNALATRRGAALTDGGR